MAKINVAGLDLFLTDLRNLEKETRNINKGALGEGAKVAAEEMRDTLETLPIRPDKPTKEDHDKALYGVTDHEYDQILENFGISRFKNSSGGWNTSIGFKGYVHTPSKMFGDKVPTGLLVQAVENGTDFRRAWHGIGGVQKKLKGSVEQAMQDYIDKEVNKIMK